VEDGAVLDVGAGADADAVGVATDDGVHPEGGLGAEVDVADELGGGVDVAAGGDGGGDAAVGADHGIKYIVRAVLRGRRGALRGDLEVVVILEEGNSVVPPTVPLRPPAGRWASLTLLGMRPKAEALGYLIAVDRASGCGGVLRVRQGGSYSGARSWVVVRKGGSRRAATGVSHRTYIAGKVVISLSWDDFLVRKPDSWGYAE
jgi:hypothetical protein